MGSDTFTGVILLTFIKDNMALTKYTIISGQCPENYSKSIEKFKLYYDLNKLYWTSLKSKAYEIALKTENIKKTTHGIFTIDYTNEEPIEMKIMFLSEYKNTLRFKNLLESSFNILIYIFYVLFMLKLYSNLFY